MAADTRVIHYGVTAVQTEADEVGVGINPQRVLFGPLGDGTDDAARLAAILADYASGAAGGLLEVELCPGTYAWKTPCPVPSRVVILGNPSALIQSTIVDDADPLTAMFVATYGALLSSTTVNGAGALRGGDFLTTTAIPVVGQILLILNAVTGGNAANTRGSIHRVVAVADHTATLDRPLPRDYPNASVVRVLASVPGDILIDGRGMVFSGTGANGIALDGAERCAVRNVQYAVGAAAVSNAFVRLGIGCHDVALEDVVVQLSNALPTVGGIAVQSVDHCRLVGCEVERSSGVGIALLDSADVEMSDCQAGGCQGVGFLISSASAAAATTVGCVNVTMTGACSALGCGLDGASAGVRVDRGAVACRLSCASLGNTDGWLLGDGTSVLSHCTVDGSAQRNGRHGVLAMAGAGDTLIRRGFVMVNNVTDDLNGTAGVEQEGVLGIVLTNANKVLTWAESQFATLEVSGAFAADRTVTTPSTPGLTYLASNQSSAAFDLILASATGGAIHVAQNKTALTRVRASDSTMVRVTADA